MQKMINASVPIMTFWLWLATTNNVVLAGTAQIYSPAGLPRSSNQDYSIPDTTISPQTFPAPPIPLGDIGIQNFSNVSLRNEITTNASAPKAQDNITQSTLPAPTASGSVESLFQCAPVSPITGVLSPGKNKAIFGGLGKVIWHTLDNLGVPMVIGKDNDLGPSLNQAYITQSQSTSTEANSNLNPIHQRIPNSELGITDIPTKNDAKLP